MKVILLADVDKIGKKDQVLEVKEGYGRNYLLARKLAVEATPANLKELKRKKAAEAKAEAEELAQKLKGATVTVSVKCGDGGRLFGAVTNKEIAERLEKEHKLKIDKRKIELEENIKSLGTYTPTVRLHPQVVTKVTVKVVEA